MQQVCNWVYNLYFHPCTGIPGPFLCRMSFLPNLYYCWKGTKHLEVDKFHRKYGMIPRVPYSPGKRGWMLKLETT